MICEFDPRVLKKRRYEFLKISQEDFVKKVYEVSCGSCSITRQAYSNLESGRKTRIDPYMFGFICRAAQISPNELFGLKL